MGFSRTASHRRAFWGIGAAFVFTLVVVAPASATLSLAVSLPELVQEAEHVVVAEAVDSNVHRDHLHRIVTDVTFRVEENLKGSSRAGGTLEVRRLGGVIGDIGLRVEGEPSFRTGNRYLLFVQRFRSGGPLRPIGMSQGVLRIERQSGIDVAIPSLGGLGLRQRGPDGRLQPAEPAFGRPQPLDVVRVRIGEILASLPANTPGPVDNPEGGDVAPRRPGPGPTLP